jgi:HK97 family phage major capsid protein/HK97 family phage prohead protease
MNTAPEIVRRSMALEAVATKDDTLTLSFSSEAPVARSFGDEVLSHAAGAVDLSRLNDGAPLLWNHDPNQLLGVVESAQISSSKGRAVVRWGSSPEAQQRRADVENGVIRNVSVGYQIDEMQRQGDVMVATSWTPLEISLVAIAADPNVGIGRSLSQPAKPSMTYAKQQPIQTGGGDLDFTPDEQKRYSLIRAVKAAATGDWSQAGFERECSRALEQQMGREARGFFIPENISVRSTYSTGTANAAGNLVGTELHSEMFIDALRNRLAVAELGATMLPGLVGNVDIPRRTGLTSTYWVAEGSAVTESNGTFDLVSLRPKTVGALSSWTRLMSLQSTPQLEDLIRQDMVTQLATAIDLAAINGSGSSNQPTGLLNTSGVNAVAGGTNGASINFDHLADLKREVAIDNADTATAGYLSNAKVEAKLMKLMASGSGEYYYGPGAGTPGSVWGRRFVISNQIPGNLTKGTASGTCSAVIYGNFADLLIGMWGATDVLVNPFGSGFSAGNLELRAMQTIDIAVRHPESFAVMKDALTA